jgi:hypothetical protein
VDFGHLYTTKTLLERLRREKVRPLPPQSILPDEEALHKVMAANTRLFFQALRPIFTGAQFRVTRDSIDYRVLEALIEKIPDPLNDVLPAVVPWQELLEAITAAEAGLLKGEEKRSETREKTAEAEDQRTELKNALTPKIAEGAKGIRLGYNLDAVRRAELGRLSVPTTVATVAGNEFDPRIDAAHFAAMVTEFMRSIVRTPEAMASDQFKISQPDSVMPTGEFPGFVVDILEGLPSDAKWKAIEAVLMLNKNQHYGMILLTKPDTAFLARVLSMNTEIQKRFHYKNIGSGSPAHVLRNNVQKMFGEVQRGEMAQAFKNIGEAFVITGTEPMCNMLGEGLPAAVVERAETRDQSMLDAFDTAGTAVAAAFSQVLLRGAELSEKMSKAIQKVGRRYQFIPEGLKALLSKLTAEIQGLLSIRQAA